ncbi:chloramphenicol O-acetyltransferase type A [Clostridium acetobutylicum]|uniref:Chloramphenicol O-acetyltransferase n=1 Tax=Clostridium acetobutylicum (strain ATCC 824 / DSM 792 / JCM 1419 / IAM 19013 / LMG 5710 / NBRC 13948 / NRRL B-527 / VKM B-1787 / 2291 / W) TaxID=272562 RepID=Q97TN8_CLOAB|nr:MULTISPECIES: chloramphenicol acetyltransferase CAT [Clostridium]AAK76806.1 Chloramphenicol O-acetyltransferase [Clostridium acetobutylicum ATCC 824]ADZ22842.1 Chloramphenicol O-acetyltransferase [Clostridium acetobutylicum EA 2018]AEI34802.1 chloramphenicol O-acetyltransferase [Clostridium acetobutylicum DSM 1731]AWV82351.1 chloramphenicol acetyltransferase CAT [Clostridium acetobutylicum]MBC2395806.1 chloramphenicol acetyltransferase CAT [Clostridium acetobutylicum]
MNSNFHAIDMNTYPRAHTYNYFTKTVSTLIYSINITLDVTILRATLKNKGLKFFPAYVYLVTRAIGRHQEFLMAIQNDMLGYWDCRTPFYPIFHEDDKTITFLWTEYNEDFEVFYKNYISDIREYGNNHGIMLSKDAPPSNNYIISCIPWFSFNSLSMQLQNAKNYYAPIFEAGRFTETNGIITLPLSITVNHATVDGYHIKLLLDELQWSMSHPKEWIR